MPNPDDHQAHDPALVAAYAAGDLAGAQFILANRLLATCEACARLHADLRAIAAATHALPAHATAPRDYRLSPEQARRVRRGSLVRRLLRPFANPSSGVRPLATTFSGLGAIGLAIVLLLPVFGGPAALPAGERNTMTAVDSGASAAPAVPGEAVPGGAAAGPTQGIDAYGPATAEPGQQAVDLDGDKKVDEEADPDSTPAVGQAPNPATIVLIGSTALLVIGLVLFALRSLARRVA